MAKVYLPALALLSTLGGCAGRHSSRALQGGPFADEAQQAGVRFRWTHGGRSPLNIIESLGHGCAFLDYDQDGLLDILLVGNRGIELYHNLGGGRFKDVTEFSGFDRQAAYNGVAVGDYDNDGFPDVYLTGYGKCALYHNERRRTPLFKDVTARAGVGALGPFDTATAAAFVDLDGDGRLDLFVGRYIVFTPQTPQLCDFHGVRAGCGVASYLPAYPRVYRNLGHGRFADATHQWGFDAAHGKCLGVAVRAANSSPGVALYCANDERPGDLFLNHGARYVNAGASSNTAYNVEGLPQGGMGVDWGQFGASALPGLVVATFQREP
ncbi:MAG TPA: VCBS repeat-containing protein, partial [Chthonomonadales bacterium]|nr:VCBS repeat-containing protein [Chthonomonadales bacterium]